MCKKHQHLQNIATGDVYSVERMGYKLDTRGTVVRFAAMASLFSNATRPTLETSQHPSQRVQGRFHQELSDRGVKLTTHLNLVPRLRISGAKLPFPHMPSSVYLYLLNTK